MQLEADTCSGCGQPLSESTDEDNEGGYEVPPPTRCHACTALHAGQQRYELNNPHGLMFEVHRRTGR
jgi:hypothetical protein